MCLKAILLRLIGFYRRRVSPLLPPACRFYPTCSTYALEAVERFGVFKGSILAVYRILRCNPYCKGGVDKVPPRQEGEPFFQILARVHRREYQ